MRFLFGRIIFVVTFTIVIFSSLVSAYTWNIEDITESRYFESYSKEMVALDSSGNPHVVYGGDRLYYQYYNGSQWVSEIADQTRGSGRAASIVLDVSGNPHISHVNAANKNVRYTHYTGGVWQSEIIDHASTDATCIELDSNGNPCILYLSDGYIHFARRSLSGWDIHTSSYLSISSQSLSMVLDSADYPHISVVRYYEYRYLYQDGTGWHWEDIEPMTGQSLEGMDIILDADGYPHIVYCPYRTSEYFLTHAYKNTSGWNIDDVTSFGAYRAFGINITIDQTGYLHLTYSTRSSLYYQYENSSGWNTEIIDNNSRTNTLCLDTAENPVVAYLRGNTGQATEINIAIWTGSDWDISLLDTDNPSYQPHLTYTNMGQPHVSYSNSGISFAVRSGGNWQEEINIDGSISDIGIYGSQVMIPCYNFPDIEFTYFTGTGWNTEFITSGANVSAIDLEVSSDGFPHIVYHNGDFSNNQIVYAYRDTNSWHTEILGSGGGMLQAPPKLALDQNDRPHVIYYDSSLYEMIYAHNPGGSWNKETFLASNPEYVDLKIAPDDHPMIAYIDPTNVYLAEKINDVWGFETVVSSLDVRMRMVSIEATALGEPCLLYIEDNIDYYDQDSLVYVEKSGNTWQFETLTTNISDNTINAFSFELVMDPYGNPGVVYQDYIARNVKFASSVLNEDVPSTSAFGLIILFCGISFLIIRRNV
ncbi:hypothetical protein K8T06_03735 [bacterium]|nr:hypothetical protein [bacterium]